RPAAALLAAELVHNLVVTTGGETLLTGQVALGKHGLEFHVTVADRRPVDAVTDDGWRVADLVAADRAIRAGVEPRDSGKITWAVVDLRPGTGGHDFPAGHDSSANPSTGHRVTTDPAPTTAPRRASSTAENLSSPPTPWSPQQPAAVPSPWQRTANEMRNDAAAAPAFGAKGAMPPDEADIGAAWGIDDRRARAYTDPTVHGYRRNPWVLNRFGPGDTGPDESRAPAPEPGHQARTPVAEEQGIRLGKIEVHPRAAEFDVIPVDPMMYIPGIAEVLDVETVYF